MALLPYGSEKSVRKVKLNVARLIGNSEAAAKPFAKMANQDGAGHAGEERRVAVLRHRADRFAEDRPEHVA